MYIYIYASTCIWCKELYNNLYIYIIIYDHLQWLPVVSHPGRFTPSFSGRFTPNIFFIIFIFNLAIMKLFQYFDSYMTVFIMLCPHKEGFRGRFTPNFFSSGGLERSFHTHFFLIIDFVCDITRNYVHTKQGLTGRFTPNIFSSRHAKKWNIYYLFQHRQHVHVSHTNIN